MKNLSFVSKKKLTFNNKDQNTLIFKKLELKKTR